MGAGSSLRVVRLHLGRVLAALRSVAACDAAGNKRHRASEGPGPALAAATGCSSPR